MEVAKARKSPSWEIDDNWLEWLLIQASRLSFEQELSVTFSNAATLGAPARPDLIEELLKEIELSPDRDAVACRERINKYAALIRKIRNHTMYYLCPL